MAHQRNLNTKKDRKNISRANCFLQRQAQHPRPGQVGAASLREALDDCRRNGDYCTDKCEIVCDPNYSARLPESDNGLDVSAGVSGEEDDSRDAGEL